MACLSPWVDFMMDEVIKDDQKILNSMRRSYNYTINGKDITIEGEKLLIYKIANTMT